MAERINIDLTELLQRANAKTIRDLVMSSSFGLKDDDLIVLTPGELEIIIGQASLTGFYSNNNGARLDDNKVS